MALAVNGTKRIIYVGLALAGAVMFLGSDALAKSGGTSSLHVMFKKVMTNTGVAPNASGNVSGTLTRAGNANSQQLGISLAGLSASTAYQLIAFIGDDVNAR